MEEIIILFFLPGHLSFCLSSNIHPAVRRPLADRSIRAGLKKFVKSTNNWIIWGLREIYRDELSRDKYIIFVRGKEKTVSFTRQKRGF